MTPEAIAHALACQQFGRGGKRPPWHAEEDEEEEVDIVDIDENSREEPTDPDSALVPPLPVVAFLQARAPHKACGHCAECRRPPCGSCRSCEQNARLSPEKLRECKRRCEALRCVRERSMGTVAPQPTPPNQESLPSTLEGIREELDQLKHKIRRMDQRRGSSKFSEKRSSAYAARKASLIVAASAREQPRKVRFPVGFADTWGVVNAMEKNRHKFATFVVKQSHAGDARTLVTKREMRDVLDGMILQFCSRFGEFLAPVDDQEAFWAALAQHRGAPRHKRSRDESDSDA
jgi:hypothetical protein